MNLLSCDDIRILSLLHNSEFEGNVLFFQEIDASLLYGFYRVIEVALSWNMNAYLAVLKGRQHKMQ